MEFLFTASGVFQRGMKSVEKIHPIFIESFNLEAQFGKTAAEILILESSDFDVTGEDNFRKLVKQEKLRILT
jgi:hypothetical protein